MGDKLFNEGKERKDGSNKPAETPRPAINPTPRPNNNGISIIIRQEANKMSEYITEAQFEKIWNDIHGTYITKENLKQVLSDNGFKIQEPDPIKEAREYSPLGGGDIIKGKIDKYETTPVPATEAPATTEEKSANNVFDAFKGYNVDDVMNNIIKQSFSPNEYGNIDMVGNDRTMHEDYAKDPRTDTVEKGNTAVLKGDGNEYMKGAFAAVEDDTHATMTDMRNSYGISNPALGSATALKQFADNNDAIFGAVIDTFKMKGKNFSDPYYDKLTQEGANPDYADEHVMIRGGGAGKYASDEFNKPLNYTAPVISKDPATKTSATAPAAPEKKADAVDIITGMIADKLISK